MRQLEVSLRGRSPKQSPIPNKAGDCFGLWPRSDTTNFIFTGVQQSLQDDNENENEVTR